MTSADLHNLKNGQKKDLVRKLIFRDFVKDPQAIRYFRHYLEKHGHGFGKSDSFSLHNRNKKIDVGNEPGAATAAATAAALVGVA